MFNNRLKKVVAQVNNEFGKLFDWANDTHIRIVRNSNQTNINFKKLETSINNLVDLQERLGQKVKDQKIDIQMILMGILKKLNLVVNENGLVEELKTKVSKNAKPKTTSIKSSTRKQR